MKIGTFSRESSLGPPPSMQTTLTRATCFNDLQGQATHLLLVGRGHGCMSSWLAGPMPKRNCLQASLFGVELLISSIYKSLVVT